MSIRVKLTPSLNNYTRIMPISGVNYAFANIHWNSEDAGWYFDLLEEDGTPILAGIKLVLGVSLGRTSTHPFFKANILTLVDSSGDHKDPGFDDLGGRVQLAVTVLADRFKVVL